VFEEMCKDLAYGRVRKAERVQRYYSPVVKRYLWSTPAYIEKDWPALLWPRAGIDGDGDSTKPSAIVRQSTSLFMEVGHPTIQPHCSCALQVRQESKLTANAGCGREYEPVMSTLITPYSTTSTSTSISPR